MQPHGDLKPDEAKPQVGEGKKPRPKGRWSWILRIVFKIILAFVWGGRVIRWLIELLDG